MNNTAWNLSAELSTERNHYKFCLLGGRIARLTLGVYFGLSDLYVGSVMLFIIQTFSTPGPVICVCFIIWN